MLWHINEDQKEVINALKSGDYLEYPNQPSNSSTSYITSRGTDFKHLHGLGNGNGVLIMDEWQPRFVAKRVRRLLAKSRLKV